MRLYKAFNYFASSHSCLKPEGWPFAATRACCPLSSTFCPSPPLLPPELLKSADPGVQARVECRLVVRHNDVS